MSDEAERALEPLRSTFTINLTRGKQALVDERDWYELRKYKWFAEYDRNTKSFYARRSVRQDGRPVGERMHRRILGLRQGDPRVDHVNHNTLDNRRKNLRIVSNRKNAENRRDQSVHGAGVQLTRSGRFEVLAVIDAKKCYVGRFTTENEAQEARRRFVEEAEAREGRGER